MYIEHHIEHQVCSIELAKKLKELGVKQNSLYYYHKFCQTYKIGYSYDVNFICENCENEIYSAFTCAEIGELLPAEIGELLPAEGYIKMSINVENKKELVIPITFKLTIIKTKLIYMYEHEDTFLWSINYNHEAIKELETFIFPQLSIEEISDINEANARAKMLIFLIENGHIKNEIE